MPSAVRSRLASAGGSPIVPVAWIVAPSTPASTAAIASPSALRRNRPLTLNAPLGSRSRVSADSSERSDPVAATVNSVPTQRGSSPSVPPTVSDVPPTRTFSASRKSRRPSRRRRPARSNGRGGSPTTPVHAPTTAASGPAASTSAVNRFGAQQLLQRAARRRRDAAQDTAQVDAHRVVLRRQPAFGAERAAQRGLQAEDRQRRNDVRAFDLQVDVRSAERHGIVDASVQREGRLADVTGQSLIHVARLVEPLERAEPAGDVPGGVVEVPAPRTSIICVAESSPASSAAMPALNGSASGRARTTSSSPRTAARSIKKGGLAEGSGAGRSPASARAPSCPVPAGWFRAERGRRRSRHPGLARGATTTKRDRWRS